MLQANQSLLQWKSVTYYLSFRSILAVESNKTNLIFLDAESEPQSNDISQQNGLSTSTSVLVDSKSAPESVSETLPDSGKEDAIPEPIPIEKVFDIRISNDGDELKSMTVKQLESVEEPAPSESELPSGTTEHTVTGVVELCNYMIDHFTKLKRSVVNEDASPKVTPRGRGSSKKGNAKTVTSSQTTPKSGKRNSTSKIDESESKPKQTKGIADKSTDEEMEEKGDCCLARWTDRKYYAGRVLDEKPGNKFSVLFEDGAMKNLSAEVIVFGTGNVLPLMDHSVHVLVADDTYEPGIVTKIETEDDVVKYTVVAESKTVTCSASDIYLMDDQAKVIHNSLKSKEVLKSPETPSAKRTGRLPAKLEETITSLSGGRSSRGKKGQPAESPEPGFSGDVDAKKAGRRSTKR